MTRIMCARARSVAVVLCLGWFVEPAQGQRQDAASGEQAKPYVYQPHPDESESFEAVFAVTAGGGLDSRSSPILQYAGIKIGTGCCVRGKHPNEDALTLTLDLGYDRVRSHNGVSGELSMMVPVTRFPDPAKSHTKRFVRLYAEPGVGVRAGGGASAYVSAKVMVALMSAKQISTFGGCPVLEIQRRLPLSTPARGDTRVIIGFMYPLCKHCGVD